MQTLIEQLPVIHVGLSLLLLLFVVFRTAILLKDPVQAYSKKMLDRFSLLVLVVFFSGIALGFVLKIPFSHPFILTKIIGFLAFVALNLVAFTPGRQKLPALSLVAAAIILFILLFLAPQ